MAVLRQPIKDESKRQENIDEDFSSGSSNGDILPTAKGDLEYVKLVKISRNQYEDPRKLINFYLVLEIYVLTFIFITVFS